MKEQTYHIFNIEPEILNGLQHAKEKQVIIYKTSEQYIVPWIYMNPEWRKTINNWFPKRNVAHVLYHYLLHPRDVIWEKILQTYALVRPTP